MLKRVFFLYLTLMSLCYAQNLKDVECMTRAIYFESANQSELGKIAVGHVILNRMQKLHKNTCEVVYEVVGGKKQFTWNHQKKIPSNDLIRYNQCERIAINIFLKKTNDPTNGAFFFHSRFLKNRPKWANSKNFTVKIQDHLFYK